MRERGRENAAEENYNERDRVARIHFSTRKKRSRILGEREEREDDRTREKKRDFGEDKERNREGKKEDGEEQEIKRAKEKNQRKDREEEEQENGKERKLRKREEREIEI